MNKKNVKITKRAHAFKRFASSFEIFYPELQLKDTKSSIKNKLKRLLSEWKGLKFVTKLFLVLKKTKSEDKTVYDKFYSHSKAETIINVSDIDDNVFKSIYGIVISKKSLGKGLGWIIIDSVIGYNINISKYNPAAGSSYIKLKKRMRSSKKRID